MPPSRLRFSARLPRLFRLAQRLKRLPLRAVLIIPFVLQIILVVGLTGYLSYLNGQEAVRDLVGQLEQQVGDRVSQKLESYLKTPQLINQINADAVRLGLLDLEDMNLLERHIRSQFWQFNPRLMGSSPAAPATCSRSQPTDTPQQPSRNLTAIAIATETGNYIDLGYNPEGVLESAIRDVNRDGKMNIWQVNDWGSRTKVIKTLPNYDPRNRPWYRKPVQAGISVWVEPYLTLPYNDLSISVDRPLYNQQGTLMGVADSTLSLLEVSSFLCSLDVGQTGQVFIFQPTGKEADGSPFNGRLIGTSTGEQLYRGEGENKQGISVLDSRNPITRATANYLLQTSPTRSLDGITQAIQRPFSIDRQQFFVRAFPFPSAVNRPEFRGLNWMVAIVVAQDDFMEQINANTRTTLLLSLAALIGSFALGVWIGRSSLCSVRQLGLASAVTEGQQQEKIGQDSAVAETLRRNANRLRNLAAAAPVNIYSLVRHPDGSIEFEYINRVVEEFHEISLEQFLANPEQVILEQMHSDDRPGYLEHFAHSAQSLERFQYEWRIITPSGKLKWLQAFSQPERRKNGDICWHGVVLDISDRKQTEEALRQSELLFRGAFETSAFGISIRSLTGRYLQVNQALCKMLGYTEAEMLQLTYRDMTHPDDLAIDPNNTIRRLLQGEIPYYHLEKRFLHKEGHIVWGLLSMSLVQDLQQQPLYIVAQIQDITSRKQAEEALRQSDTRFQKIAAASPAQIYILVYDPATNQMRFEYLSPGSREIQELEPEQVLNNPMLTYEQVHPADRQAYNEASSRSFKALEPFSHEWRIVTPSGKLKWVRASSRPELRENGQIAWYGVLLDITDHKQAEESLRQSEETKNQILKAIPDLLIWMTVDGIYLDIIESKDVASFVPRSERIGRNVRDIMPAELAHKQIYANQQAKQTGEVQIYEQKITIQGKLQYEEVRVVAVGDDKILTIIRNITQRKQTEAELEAQRVFLRQLIDVIPNPVFVKDAEGRFIVANQKLAELHGLTIADILNRQEAEFNSYLTPAQLAQYLANNQEVMRSRYPKQNSPEQVVAADGRQRWLQTLLSPFVDAEGQVRGVVGTCVDVTELKQVEEALQQQNQALRDSEERFRSAFHNAPIGMALIGLDDRWLKVNPMLCDMFGCSEAELLIMNASTLVHPEDQNKLQQCIQQMYISENRSVQVELRYCCNNGKTVWSLMSLSLVRDAQTQPLYYVAQIQDITKQHAIDRMKNEFISIVSHELRTPLTAIRGFLGLLNTGIYSDRPEKAKRMIEQSLANSDRLVRLVNDILDLERLSSGSIQLSREVCDAEVLLYRAVEGLQSIADQCCIRLLVVPTVAQVWAAPDAIIQTLTNLLSNALKFSPPRSTITLAAQPQAGSVLFQVQDEGRGIPADKLETIFGRFQQVDVSDARQKGGTGLGLTICQSIVQQHGGSIWAESILGSGSTFYFTLPMPPEKPQH